MKNPRATLLRLTFPLFSFLFPVAFALPFQEPIPGIYQCFAVGEDPYSLIAQDTGATLELHPNQTYTLQAPNASEQGAFVFGESTEDYFFIERGSLLNLKANNSTVSYLGTFFVDRLGGMYVLVLLSDYNWLRCQSPNADFATAMDSGLGSFEEPLADLPEIPVTPEDELLPATTKAPAPPAGAGGLSGFYVYEDTEGEYIPTFANNIAGGYFEFHNEYLYFLPEGYVYPDIYQWSYEALDCTRVGKDNRPLCGTYVVSGNTITIEGYSSSFVKDGNDLLIDGRLFKYQPPTDGLKFDGRFLFAFFDGYTLDEAYYTFSKDSTFKAESSSANNATASVGGTTTYSSSYSETPVLFGAYAIRGNTIEFIYQDGSSVKKVFTYEKDASGQVAYIYINGTIYSRE
jgi:hypothetical protein